VIRLISLTCTFTLSYTALIGCSGSAVVSVKRAPTGPETVVVEETAEETTTSDETETITVSEPDEQNIILVTWNAEPGAITYTVEIAADEDCTDPLIEHENLTETSTEINTSEFTTNGTYYVCVTSFDEAGSELTKTKGQTVTVSDIVLVVAPPTNLSLSSTDNTITLTWQEDLTDETGFAIERSLDQTTWTVINTTATDIISYVDQGLSVETTYFYRLRSVKGEEKSSYTAVKSLKTKLVKPTLVAVERDKMITLSWSAITGATSYDLFYSSSAGVTEDSTKIENVSSPYTRNNLTNNQSVYYKLKAISSANTSNLSNELIGTARAEMILNFAEIDRLQLWRGQKTNSVSSSLSSEKSALTAMPSNWLFKKAFSLNGSTGTHIADNPGFFKLGEEHPVFGRTNHSMSVVGTKIIIFGGIDNAGQKRNDVWAFDTADNSWALLKADDDGAVEDTDYPKRRRNQSQSTIGSKIILFGGLDSASQERNDVWAFDTTDNSWAKLIADDVGALEDTDYPKRRHVNSQSTVGSKIIVFGGLDNASQLRNDVWGFDTTDNTWTKLKNDDDGAVEDTDYPKNRYAQSQSTIGTKVIIFGGSSSTILQVRNDVWSFDTTDNSWAKLKADDDGATEDTDYPKKRYYNSQSTIGSKIIIFGGLDSANQRRNDVWSFDTTDNSWAKLKADDDGATEDTDYPKKRYFNSQSTIGSKIIIFGGTDSLGKYRNDVWAFETTDNSWVKLKADNNSAVTGTNYPGRRMLHSQSTVGTKIIVFGGYTYLSQEKNNVWAFDTTDNSWSKLKADDDGAVEDTDYPKKRSYHSQSTIGSKIIIFGGLDSASQRRNDVWAFDTTDNSWTKLKADDDGAVEDTDYPKRRSFHSQSTVGTKIIIIGGFSTAQRRNDVWAFDTTDNSWAKLKADDDGSVEDTDYPKRRYYQSQSTIGTKVIIFGGEDSLSLKRNDVWAFDTGDNSWAKLKADDDGAMAL